LPELIFERCEKQNTDDHLCTGMFLIIIQIASKRRFLSDNPGQSHLNNVNSGVEKLTRFCHCEPSLRAKQSLLSHERDCLPFGYDVSRLAQRIPQGRSFAMTAKFMIDASSVVFSSVEHVKPSMRVIQIYSKR
jgi:hypothetical protein